MSQEINNKISFSKMRSIFMFGLIIGFSILFLYLVSPLFYPIFWAAVLAVMLYPMYGFLLRKVKIKELSAFLTILFFLVTVFLPLSLLAVLFIRESSRLLGSFDQQIIVSNIEKIFAWALQSPAGSFFEKFQSEWTGYATEIVNYIRKPIESALVNTGRFIIMFCIMLYILYYFLKDGARILKRAMHLSPLSDAYERMLYERFTSTIRATLKSTIIIGGVQAFISGVLFWFTGIQGALAWAIITFFLSVIPGVGPFLVWFPAGIFLLVTGALWQGVLVLVVGATVISTIDNLMRPPLIGKDTQMHPVIIFVGTIGGLILFNISGFIIGPIICALFLAITSIYDYYYRNELQNN